MTPEQQRIAIAEACGWTAKEDEDGFWRAVEPFRGMRLDKWVSERNVWNSGIPDYLKNLNAMHEAEKVLLTNCQSARWERYDNHLAAACGGFARAHATAAQRAEAFLRTLNLWSEDTTPARIPEGDR